MNATIVPHASYSVPDQLRKKIIENNKGSDLIISVHNQETPSEEDMISSKTGELAEVLLKKGFDFHFINYRIK